MEKLRACFADLLRELERLPRRTLRVRFVGYVEFGTAGGEACSAAVNRRHRRTFWSHFNLLRPRLRYPARRDRLTLIDYLCATCPADGLPQLESWFRETCGFLKVGFDLGKDVWKKNLFRYSLCRPSVQLWLLQHGMERQRYGENLQVLWMLKHPQDIGSLLSALPAKQQSSVLKETLYHYFMSPREEDRPLDAYLRWYEGLPPSDYETTFMEHCFGNVKYRCSPRRLVQLCQLSLLRPSLFTPEMLGRTAEHIREHHSFHELIKTPV
jgi:hypothetical protein